MVECTIFIEDKFAAFAAKRLSRHGKIQFDVLVFDKDIQKSISKKNTVPLIVYLPDNHWATKEAAKRYIRKQFFDYLRLFDGRVEKFIEEFELNLDKKSIEIYIKKYPNFELAF